MFYTVTIGDTDYQCRLATKNVINLEKRLGGNLLNILMDISETNLPQTETMLIIFHESLLNAQHGITFEQVCDIYDKYIEEGHSFTDLMNVVIAILQESGVIPKETKDTKKRKN